MADTFFNDLSKALDEGEEQQEVSEVEKIKLGEKEYTQEDLSKLVGLGEIAKEAEEKYNTRIDKVWPEYGKGQNRIKELEAELEVRKQAEIKAQAPVNVDEEVARKQALDAAKGLGLVTKEDFENYMAQHFQKFYVRETQATQLLSELDDLQDEVNGKDGRPAFNKDEVLKHMAESGISKPMSAYKDLYETQLDAWKEEQYKKAKKPGLVTESSSAPGSKTPSEVKATKDNLQILIAEALYGGQ